MGRGRAKAKQTKVARALKYGSVHSDLGALQAELSQHAPTELDPARPEPEDTLDDEDDPYAGYDDDDLDDTADEPARRAR